MRRWIGLISGVILGIGFLVPPVAAQEPQIRLIPINGELLESRLSPDGLTLAVFENGIYDDFAFDGAFVPIQLVNLASGEVMVLESDDYAFDAAWSGNGATLITLHGGGWLSFWDVANGTEYWRMPILPGTARMAVEPVTAEKMVVPMQPTSSIFGVWDLTTGVMTSLFTHPYATYQEYYDSWGSGPPDNALWIGLTPGGETLIELTVYDRIWAWDLASGKATLLREADDAARPNLNIRLLSMTEDGTTVAYYHRDDEHLYTMNVATGTETDHGKIDASLPPVIAADGSRIAWYSGDSGTINVWDVGQPLTSTQVITPNVSLRARGSFREPPIKLTPDGSQVIFTGYAALDGGENTVLVIDLP